MTLTLAPAAVAAFSAAWLCSAVVGAAGSDERLIQAIRAGDLRTVQSLVAANTDVNVTEPDGTTALAWAVYRDDVEATDALVSAGADVNKANDYGVTPLWLACSNRNGAVIEKLLGAGANPNATLWTGETVLMTCARAGAVDGAKSLLARGAVVNATEPRRGQTALMWAAAARRPELTRVLIERGADVHARSHARQGFGRMVFATWGGDVAASSPGGFTALMFAAQQGDLESAELLLKAGARINEPGPYGMTPLLMAASIGHEALAIALLERGADPRAADVTGVTALHYALREGFKIIHGLADEPDVQEIHSNDPEVLKRLSQMVLVSSTQAPPSAILPGGNMVDLARALVARGADPNAALAEIPPMLRLERRPMISLLGATPFLLASVAGDVSILRLLAEKGARATIGTRVDERQMSEKGYSDDAQIQGNATPLMVAAGLGRESLSDEAKAAALEAVKLAVSLGADVNAAGATGWTALHAAAYMGAEDIVAFLVQKGATIDVQNGCGQTPLSLAQGDDARGLLKRTKVQTATVNLLKKLGAGKSRPNGPVGKCVEGRWGI